MSDSRPPSPFLTLLLVASTAALVSEWLRFQWGWGAAAPLAVAGTALALWSTGRAFRARRRWRQRRQRGELAPRVAPAPTPDGDSGWSLRARQEPASALREVGAGALASSAPHRIEPQVDPGSGSAARPAPGRPGDASRNDVEDTLPRR